MKNRYMLDTDTVSFALRGMGGVGGKILQHLPSELCVSSITVAELNFGVEKRGSRKLRRLVDTFLSEIEVIQFDGEDAAEFGSLAAKLEKRGDSIAPMDGLLAAHAKSRGMTFVTNNTRHFKKVAGLKIENWYED